MSVQISEPKAVRDGKDIVFFDVEGPTGLRMRMTNYGGVIIKLLVPDRDGRPVDVVLGFDEMGDYFTRSPKCGALIGRFANRIDTSSFDLNGEHYELEPSRDGYTIHGGPNGFDRRVMDWEVTGDAAVTLTLVSEDGDAGFPGKLTLKATYALTDENALELKYEMQSDKDTYVNITNHSYFNLSGAGEGDVNDHTVMIDADTVLEGDSRCVPTGVMLSVAGTPMDFRTPHIVGQTADADYEQLSQFGGYDHSYALNGSGAVCASAWSPKTGIKMEVETTMPAVQFYTSNGMDIKSAKDGKDYGKRAGLCFETQFHPDSPHHPEFPSSLLRKGEEVTQVTTYRFSVEDAPNQ